MSLGVTQGYYSSSHSGLLAGRQLMGESEAPKTSNKQPSNLHQEMEMTHAIHRSLKGFNVKTGGTTPGKCNKPDLANPVRVEL